MESDAQKVAQSETIVSAAGQLEPEAAYGLFLEQYLEPVILPSTVQAAATPTWSTVRSVPTWDDF